MKIETKYDINDELFFMKDNKIYTAYVWAVDYEESMMGGGYRAKKIFYHMNPHGKFKEEVLFSTKEELLKSL